MRIGILTLPLHTNYGGILQAYALQTVLERMGHEVSLITCGQLKLGLYGKIRHKMAPIKRIAKQYLIPDKYSKDLSRHTRKFINKWIHRELFDSISSIKHNQYDAGEQGTDAVQIGGDGVYYEM